MDRLEKYSGIRNRIFVIRGKEVMVDRDLAELYDIKPIRLREQVKRNIERFPEDFMFQIKESEVGFMVSQNAIPSKQHLGGSLPYVFTEQGLYMLASVLKSSVAVEVNIAIIRTFTKLREFSLHYDAMSRQIMELEREYDTKFEMIFEQLDALVSESQKRDEKIMGFIKEK